jgi:hypothetical protein
VRYERSVYGIIEVEGWSEGGADKTTYKVESYPCPYLSTLFGVSVCGPCTVISRSWVQGVFFRRPS